MDGPVHLGKERMKVPQQVDFHAFGADSRQPLLVLQFVTVKLLQASARRFFPAFQGAQ